MTIQSRRLLRKLKKAQMAEKKWLTINGNDFTAATVINGKEPRTTVSLSEYQNSLDSVLTYLIDIGMLMKNPNHLRYYQLTHKGWYWQQAVASKVGKFLLTSIVVPIVVSALTALITLWIASFIK